MLRVISRKQLDMNQTDPLIRTKLHPPYVRPELVTRNRLVDQIALGLSGPLTLITAPAGFGKTTLLVTATAASTQSVAWLSLDKNDNLTGRLLRYLVAALRETNPALGKEAEQLLSTTQQVPTETVLTSLINDLHSCGKDVALVLDDYQFISNPDIHELMAFLLGHCPNTLHIVIATRSDPPIALSGLRARGQVVELRAADLRFTEDEAALFMTDIMGLKLEAELMRVLEERTEGWIAGLQMAALSMQGRDDVDSFVRAFAGTHRFVMDFMLEEVLNRESADVQAFLLKTSFLTRLSAPLCEEIIGVVGCQEMLERLERRNLFILSLDDDRYWYRYHHLFADMLQARLNKSQPQQITHLYAKAVQWCEREGLIVEAVSYAFAANQMEKAAGLIERYGPLFWAANETSVMQMAENLPEEMIVNRPKIGLHMAWLLICQGKIEKAITILEKLTQYLVNTEPHPEVRWMQTIVALAFAFLSRSYPLPEGQSLDEIPDDEPILREAADLLYGMTLGRRDKNDLAMEFTARCIQKKQTHGKGEDGIPNLVPFLARLYLMEGRLQDADNLCCEFLDPFLEKGARVNDSAGGLLVVRGEVLYERNRLGEAERLIRRGLQVSDPWQNIMIESFGLLALIHVLQAQHDYDGALQSIEKFENRLRGHSGPFEFTEDFRTVRVCLRLAKGDLLETIQWAEHIQAGKDYERYKKFYQLTLARIYLACGRYADTENILSGFTPPDSAGNRISRQIETSMMLAAAISKQRGMAETIPLIESSLALAEPDGYIQPFLLAGESARQLLSAYHQAKTPGYLPYVQKVINGFSSIEPENTPALPSTSIAEPLSVRELEVLELIARGMTNHEIANQLIVARGTIKAHAASIYRKLDVNNRTEAVSKARQLNILP